MRDKHMSDNTFIPFALPDIGSAEIDAVVEAMRSGWLTTGPRTHEFEQEFADFLGGGLHAVAVNSATAGLHLALEALGIGPGDEVIVPTWTFTATAEVVRYLGADPVFVDVESESLNIDLDVAKAAINERTRAIIPVHFGGLAVDLERLQGFADEHRLRVVEDAAHALPCTSDGMTVGRGGSAATVFSFYATKTMTTGEGGMVVTADGEMADHLRTMRLHGISRNVFDRYRSKTPSWHYDVVAPGFKYNMTDTAAAMGRVQLRRLRAMRDRRADIAHSYAEAFADLPVTLPVDAAEGDTHAWHLYAIRLKPEADVTRDEFIAALTAERIGTSVHFIPLHRQPYWRDRYHLSDEDFPVATTAFANVVSLPLYSSMNGDQVSRVIEAVCRTLS